MRIVCIYPGRFNPFHSSHYAVYKYLTSKFGSKNVYIVTSDIVKDKSPFTFKEKAFISWVGLRGAVPIILATYPYLQGFEKSNLIFNIVFFIVLFSILIQGTTLPLVAKWLKVESKSKDFKGESVIASPLFYHTLKQFYIEEKSRVIGLSIVELDLPADFLILLIKRDNDYIKPTGSTLLEENDMLLIQCNSENKYKKVLKTFQIVKEQI